MLIQSFNWPKYSNNLEKLITNENLQSFLAFCFRAIQIIDEINKQDGKRTISDIARC